MAATFSRTIQSLSTDRGRGVLWGISVAAVVLGAWACWFFLARIGVYVASDFARLEIEQAAHPVEAPVAGQVVRTYFLVDQLVEVGDLLVELDSTRPQLQLVEQQARLAALSTLIDALDQEAAVNEQGIAESRSAASFAIEEARARYEEAKAGERFTREQARRISELRAKGDASEVESRLAAAQAAQSVAAAEAARIAVARIAAEQRTSESDRLEQLNALLREGKKMEGEMHTIRAYADGLQHEIERRRIRSPVAGRVVEVASLPPGSFVKQGDRLGAIVPPGEVKIVAHFDPAKSLGRIHKGQPARLRLDGFPWSQYGTLDATVTRVAGEIRQGRVQAELSPIVDAAMRIPLQHGLPGVVEIEVERISPAWSVLRIAGRRFASQTPDQGTPTGAVER